MFMNNLKEMVRLSIIGFIALLVMGIVMSLYSCGSHKSAVMKETFVQREDSTKQSIDFGFTAIQDISNFFHSTTNRRIYWRFYDTSKPIDSETGKHPLLAEGDTEENNKIEQETNVISADSFSLQSDSLSSSWSQENDRQEQEKQKDETTVPKQISGAIWALATLLLLMIIAWIIYKKKGG
jgi:hypothetical protein